MKNYRQLYKALVLITPIFGMSLTYAQKLPTTFKPSPEPILSTPKTKPNIHMILDDSGSMDATDIRLPEHAYGFGNPVCVLPNSYDYTWTSARNKWKEEREKNGEYDPLSTGVYIPWDDEKALEGVYGDLKKPPIIDDCKQVRRTEALNYAYVNLMKKYRDKSYLGVSLLWQGNSTNGLIRLLMDDFSTYSDIDFQNKALTPITNLIRNAPGGTPINSGVYETMKMFRGIPVTQISSGSPLRTGSQKDSHHAYIQLATPLRYRCQQNHLVLMTDGDPNGNDMYGVSINDKEIYKSKSTLSYDYYVEEEREKVVNGEKVIEKVNIRKTDLVNEKIVGELDVSVNGRLYSSEIGELGKIAAGLDLRDAKKPVWNALEKKWVNKALDDAGKPWKGDKYSIPMPLYMHTVSLQLDPKAKFYQDLTKATKGMNLGVAPGQGNANDLLVAFDTIFASIILSTSSTLSMNDRIHSDMLTEAPKVSADGSVDLKSLGTIRYDTIYDFRPRFGSVRAMVPFISGYDASKKKNPKDPNDKGEPIITSYELWNTDKSITPEQGRYVTFLKQDGKTPGLNLVELTADNILENFSKLYEKGKSLHAQNAQTEEEIRWAQEEATLAFDMNAIEWLTNFKKTENLEKLRGRLNPLGSITNSDIVTVNKDILNISVAKNKMSGPLRKELSNWLLYKARYQPKNLLIVSDNDGFISFINAQRGLTGTNKGGQRDTAYFPQMLVHRFGEIALANRTASLILEGRTNLVDAKVFQSSNGGSGGENIYATIGLTSMGGGGMGLVGYRVYAEKESVIQNWLKNKGTISTTDPNDIYEKVTPLFEITNEGPNKTAGFEDLGYTYSGFEFFNRVEKAKTSSGSDTLKGQAIAIFGNGFGAKSKKSVLYFIDAYTGAKLHEIILSPNGMGAATPSIVVSKDGDGGQKIDRIYVGDYSGTMYKVQFSGSDIDPANATVTALFKAPTSNFGQSAISVKPLVVKGDNSNFYRVFFGTGIAASLDLDRYDNSLVTHAVYGITDKPGNNKGSSTKPADSSSSLTPLLTVSNLKKGYVNYKGDKRPNYETLDRYDLDVHTPISNPNESSSSGSDNGWYIVLSADNEGVTGANTAYTSEVGKKGAGERIIRNPQYDSLNDAVVFSTWGIYERGSREEQNKEDPCISDLAFGKVLSFYTTTGGGSFAITITNKGTTGTAQGGLTGDSIESAPEGNDITKLEDLDKEDQEEILEVVDKENSSYETDKKNSGVYCVTGIDGKVECVGTNRGEEALDKKPVRLSIQTLFNA